MPCNVGYRSISRTKIKQPQPETIRSETQAPQINAELLERLGQEDQQFAEWLQELEVGPLLTEALTRALNTVDDTAGVSFAISDAGRLTAKATVNKRARKQRLQKIIDRVVARWQMEVIGIVAELIDYEIKITTDGDALVLEGEKRSNNKVHEYIRITINSNEDSEMCFEHFTDPNELKTEELRFLGLMQRLGINVTFLKSERAGQPIPNGTIHRNFLKQRS
jgi:hypothetical protein